MTTFFDGLPEHLDEPVWLSIGNFDGLHLGHQAILAALQDRARTHGGKTALLTFWPHPRVLLQGITQSYYLSTHAEKQALLASAGLDYVIELPFTQAFSRLSPQAFFQMLTAKLNLKGLLVGRDFTIGKDRVGTCEVLKDMCGQAGIEMEVLAPYLINGVPVSSNRIREQLLQGNVEMARSLLGRPYTVSGLVVEGKRLGSKLGFPTANLLVEPCKVLPQYGVYATRVRFNGSCLMGVTSVGVRPTFENTSTPNVETMVLDFDGNIYHESLYVDFMYHIRGEKRFDKVQELIAQIEQDKMTARRMLADEFDQKDLQA